MAFTQTQLDALEEAIASGTLEVQYSDKKVTYRSLNEMIRIRDLIARKLGQSSAKYSRLTVSTSKGLGRGGYSYSPCGPLCVDGCDCGYWGFNHE